ncbi:Rrf2 family transcriptional regulator [Lentisphaerota bacterium ZTH]|nr:Rrf2 family transcriptional regulator [Lentisphaerota bacterium]WET07310.1 Rrf2 family transcriptional regulator [Lentisphaerota bacterium ZTH]
MKISTRTRYGLRIMIFLATQDPDSHVNAKEISSHEHITLKYTEQIIRLLKKAGYLNVSRGAKGGYSLKPAAKNTRIKDLYNLLEKDQKLLKCLEKECCDRKAICSTYDFWCGLEEVISNYLSSKTIGDLAREYQEKSVPPMFYI